MNEKQLLGLVLMAIGVGFVSQWLIDQIRKNDLIPESFVNTETKARFANAIVVGGTALAGFWATTKVLDSLNVKAPNL
jgi:hypothetical protein